MQLHMRNWLRSGSSNLSQIKYRITKNARWWWLLFPVVAILSLWGFVWINSEVFIVKQIEVQAQQSSPYVDEQQLESVLYKYRGKNIFLLDIDEISQEIIDTNEFVGAVYVNKQVPHGLEITISEQPPVLALVSKDICILYSSDSVALKEVPKNACDQYNLPRIENHTQGSLQLNSFYIEYVVQFNNLLESNQAVLPNSYNIVKNLGFTLELNFDTYTVQLDMNHDPLYNWYLYKVIVYNLATMDVPFSSIDLTHQDPIVK